MWKRHLYGTTIAAHQQFSFFEPCAVYLRFCHVSHHQPLFYIGSTAENTLEREHSRFRKFKQVHEGHFVRSELAIRHWSHCNNSFLWSPVPIYIRREPHWALEHVVHRQPFFNSRQFGIRTVWRKDGKTLDKTSKNNYYSHGFFGVKGTAVTFHEPSFKVVYLKHSSLMDAICNHKDAI